jgi:XTP/dITP diphosphohydrolase
MLKIVVASSNKGKIAEIKAALQDLPIQLIPQDELDIEDVEETGTTFVENAIIKARHAAKISGLPVIADDSGLVVDSLGGEPGVHSARFAGENANDLDRIKKVLQEMADTGEEDRNASFHCVTVLLENEHDPAPLICEGVWDGEILTAPRGDKGFGYDPIFYVPTHDRSAAELDPKEKNEVSHRGEALRQLREVLNEVVGQED